MLLKFSLHLDAFGLVNGGGWALYDLNQRIIASEAYPGFKQDLNITDGAIHVARLFLDSATCIQLRLFP